MNHVTMARKLFQKLTSDPDNHTILLIPWQITHLPVTSIKTSPIASFLMNTGNKYCTIDVNGPKYYNDKCRKYYHQSHATEVVRN